MINKCLKALFTLYTEWFKINVYKLILICNSLLNAYMKNLHASLINVNYFFWPAKLTTKFVLALLYIPIKSSDRRWWNRTQYLKLPSTCIFWQSWTCLSWLCALSGLLSHGDYRRKSGTSIWRYFGISTIYIQRRIRSPVPRYSSDAVFSPFLLHLVPTCRAIWSHIRGVSRKFSKRVKRPKFAPLPKRIWWGCCSSPKDPPLRIISFFQADWIPCNTWHISAP